MPNCNNIVVNCKTTVCQLALKRSGNDLTRSSEENFNVFSDGLAIIDKVALKRDFCRSQNFNNLIRSHEKGSFLHPNQWNCCCEM